MRKRVTKSNRWKKIVKASASGAVAGAGIGGALGGLQEHLRIKPKIEKVKPVFDLLGKGKELKTVKRFQISKVAGSKAAIGAGLGVIAGGLWHLRRSKSKKVK